MTFTFEKPIKTQTLDELYKSIDELSAINIYPTKLSKVIREINRREKKMKEELSKINLK
jgi:hypothetical protein